MRAKEDKYINNFLFYYSFSMQDRYKEFLLVVHEFVGN